VGEMRTPDDPWGSVKVRLQGEPQRRHGSGDPQPSRQGRGRRPSNPPLSARSKPQPVAGVFHIWRGGDENPR